jgi:hypothetical protein
MVPGIKSENKSRITAAYCIRRDVIIVILLACFALFVKLMSLKKALSGKKAGAGKRHELNFMTDDLQTAKSACVYNFSGLKQGEDLLYFLLNE